MSTFFLKKYYAEVQNKQNYLLIDLMFLNILLGKLNKKGKKTLSYTILINILFFIKNIQAAPSHYYLIQMLNQMKPSILLFNKKRGTLVFELPRLLNLEQSTKKGIEWLVKSAKKGKKNMVNNLLLEFTNIKLMQGDVLKKNLNIIDLALKNRPFFYLLKKRKK